MRGLYECGAETADTAKGSLNITAPAPDPTAEQSKSKRGAAGVDGQTFEDIEKYGEERWLKELQEELQGKTCGLRPRQRVPYRDSMRRHPDFRHHWRWPAPDR